MDIWICPVCEAVIESDEYPPACPTKECADIRAGLADLNAGRLVSFEGVFGEQQ